MARQSMGGRVIIDAWWDDEQVAGELPLDLATNTWRTLLRLAIPVLAGDALDIYADGKVTNDTGIVTGIGYHLWSYDASAESGPARDATWRMIGDSLGENVTPPGHHLVLNISRMLVIPHDWPVGHSVGIAFRADAHSTGWLGNTTGKGITVDPHGILKVWQWRKGAV